MHYVTCRILIPQPGIEPGALAVKVSSPNHWAIGEFRAIFLTIVLFCS